MPVTSWTDGDVATATLLNQIEDQIVVTCTSGTRPTGIEGRLIYETDTDRIYVYTGSAWVLVAGKGETFTPQLQAVTTNPTLGTGSSQSGSYSRSGEGWVSGEGEIVFGSSGAAAGSGTYRVTLPLNASTSIHTASGSGGAGAAIGKWTARDDSGSAFQTGVLQLNATGSALLLYGSTATTNAAPWTWAANDRIQYSFGYYAA